MEEGLGGGGRRGGGSTPSPTSRGMHKPEGKGFLTHGAEQAEPRESAVRGGGGILLSRTHRPLFSTALSSNHSETKSPAEGHLPRCKNGATKRLEGGLKIPPLRNSPSAQLPSCSLNTSGVCHILCRCSRGTDLVLMKRESRCHVEGTLCPPHWFV